MHSAMGMNQTTCDMDDLIGQVLQSPRRSKRRVVAIAGAPASGKSTLAASLVAALNNAGCAAQLVPMDGFHLDNRILVERGQLDRKGAPHTFDADGLLQIAAQLGSDKPLVYPIFDRRLDMSIAGAGHIETGCDTVVIEGNYLLMDAPIWRDMAAHWDFSIMLECSMDVLEARLVQRWLDYGLTQEEAQVRARANDLPNAQLVSDTAMVADLTL